MTIADTHPRTEVLSGVLARNWWAIALRGVAAIVFGLIAFFAPGVTMLSLVLVYGAFMLVDGALDLVAGVRSARRNERWGTLILLGLVSLLAGVVAFALPKITVLAFVYLMAGWAIVSGALAVAAAVRLRGDHGRWWMGFGGALSIVAGLLLGMSPVLGAVVLTWWLGAYAVVFGGSLLALAFRLRAHRHEAHPAAAPHPA